jgi:prepilin-type N-terminal cleavage/methylation domain-containing protein
MVGRTPRAHGFTLIEMLCTVLIMAIVSTIAVDVIADTEAQLRAERAAREAVIAIRFARARAMADGVPYIVRFNVGGKTISVVDPANAYAVLAAPTGGGQMLINFGTNRDVANVAMVPSLAGDATDPYDMTFRPNGGTANSGSVSFTYGARTKVLQVPNVGDPIIVGDPRRP